MVSQGGGDFQRCVGSGSRSSVECDQLRKLAGEGPTVSNSQGALATTSTGRMLCGLKRPKSSAVHIHSFWMVVAAMVIGPIAHWIIKPEWRTLLKRKPVIPEYLQRARKSDARWIAYTQRKGWPHSKTGSY